MSLQPAPGSIVVLDEEDAVYQWAKAHPLIRAACRGQVHFALPTKTPALPALVIARAGGGVANAEVADSSPLISFSCWAKPDDKASSAHLAAAVQTAALLVETDQPTISVTGGLVTILGGSITNVIWLPDQTSGHARHVVDVLFTTQSVLA